MKLLNQYCIFTIIISGLLSDFSYAGYTRCPYCNLRFDRSTQDANCPHNNYRVLIPLVPRNSAKPPSTRLTLPPIKEKRTDKPHNSFHGQTSSQKACSIPKWPDDFLKLSHPPKSKASTLKHPIDSEQGILAHLKLCSSMGRFRSFDEKDFYLMQTILICPSFNPSTVLSHLNRYPNAIAVFHFNGALYSLTRIELTSETGIPPLSRLQLARYYILKKGSVHLTAITLLPRQLPNLLQTINNEYREIFIYLSRNPQQQPPPMPIYTL